MAKRILVVEDDDGIARTLQVNLERAGYATSIAGDGVAALAAVAEERPDLIVLDLGLPGIDGFAVLRQLRADPDTASLPVVVVTARQDDEAIQRGWQEGVHLYMTKPFEPQELVTFIGRALAGHGVGEIDP